METRSMDSWRQNPCRQVHTGHVAVPEDFIAIQRFVDMGGNPWRHDPVETARRVGIAHLGFTSNYVFRFQQYYRDYDSGLNHALVQATNGPCLFLVELYQPVKQGRDGIWAVLHVTSLR
jgi:hypothetical protein